MSELESRGLMNPAKLNAFVTGQSLEDAQAEIDEIKANTPPLSSVVGGLDEEE